jgi:hypothetical protein
METRVDQSSKHKRDVAAPMIEGVGEDGRN